MTYAAVIVAAVALGLAAFALFVALTARGRAIDAESRTIRHQQEHRQGLEATGFRRHRAEPGPSTEQLARVDPRPEDLETAEHPAPTGAYRRPPPPLPPPGAIGRDR